MFDTQMITALRRASITLGVCGAVLLGACNDNVFDGDGGGTADPPEITSLTGPTTVSAGGTLRLDIAATGQRPIETVNLTLVAGATTRDTTIAIASPALTIEEALIIQLSATLPGTSLIVTATVEDDRGNESEPRSLTIEIQDAQAPVVEILRPVGPEATVSGDTTAVGTGSTLRVEAHVADESGITEVRFIGIARRGDAELGTDVEVVRFSEVVVNFPRPGVDTLPTDTIVRRDLTQLGEESETVLIIVRATDLFGNVTADTVPVIVGGPDVQIVRPTNGGTHNQLTDLTIRVVIQDPVGVESATLTLTGAANLTVALPVAGLSAVDTLTYILSASDITALGPLTISVTARNARGVSAPGSPVTITVVEGGTPESQPPEVEFTVTPRPRLSEPLPRVEMLDTLVIAASADDQGGSGVVDLAVLIEAVLNSGQSTTALFFSEQYSPPRSNPEMTVRVAVREIYDAVSATLASTVALPDSISLKITVTAVDQAGNTALTTIPEGANSERGILLTVAGFTARLPGGGIISDAVIDTVQGDERLFLSNFSQSRVDVLDLRDSTFVGAGILAGAQPWGLFIDLSADTLIVANSGGTNLSKVPLRDATLVEDATQRVHTPDAMIYEFTRELDAQLNPRFSFSFTGYSDRPQFVAQAISTALLYSTVPTPSAPDGTIRLAVKDPTWAAYEVYFLYPGGDPSDETRSESFLIINADRVLLAATDTGDLIRIIDHVPGFPASTIDVIGTETTVFDAAWALGSDVVKCAGGLNNDAVAVLDTTFVAASGDRQWIAFGEGATADAGRIIMFDGSNTAPLDPGCLATGQSHETEIVDLIHNASERVTGLGLNANGTLGVARGDFAAYYFDRALRLEGLYGEDINPGGFGAALHPLLATESSGTSPETLSFVGTAESTIRIIDTYHFFARGDVPIRDPIVGPLRVTLPLVGFDNLGLTCPGDPACIVVKLFGVTQSAQAERPDGVVIVDVRERDIQ